jgi:hypothetical protein
MKGEKMKFNIKQLKTAFATVVPDTKLYDYMTMSTKEKNKVKKYILELSDVFYNQKQALDEFYKIEFNNKKMNHKKAIVLRKIAKRLNKNYRQLKKKYLSLDWLEKTKIRSL